MPEDIESLEKKFELSVLKAAIDLLPGLANSREFQRSIDKDHSFMSFYDDMINSCIKWAKKYRQKLRTHECF